MNSFIRTQNGLALVIDNKPYTVESGHVNYSDIVAALRDKKWDVIPNMINMARAVAKYVDQTNTNGSDLEVDVDGGVVLFRGEQVRGILVNRIIDMAIDGFDVTPMAKFLANLYANPSNKAVEQLYGWMEANGITITEDGYMLAFKRVRDDYKSFHDGTTDNSIGTTPELPRNKVDDRSDITCSHGLHFCSQAYLPHYQGGMGRVLLLKINPADVVSIPTDYNNAKGRACKYLILDELKGDARVGIETHNVIPQPVITEKTDYNASDAYKVGYTDGYKDGRGKKAIGTSYRDFVGGPPADYLCGYDVGRLDGRSKKPNLFATDADRSVGKLVDNDLSTDPVFVKLDALLVDFMGLDLADAEITPATSFRDDLGLDSLDDVELVMMIEDEFDIELADEEAEKCNTVADAVALITSKIRS
jgi:acyl carrier protein